MSANTKHIITLDKERELKFTMPAIVTLDDRFQINIFSPAAYVDFPPAKIVSLIWAGQLHTKNPLRRDQIAQHLPTDMEGYMEVCTVVAHAINDAIKDKAKAADRKQA